MQQELTRGDVVYDVGAHAGFYSLLASRLVGRNGKVYAFEPHPENFRRLLEHFVVNRVTNAVAVEAAVTKQDGRGVLIPGTDSSTGYLAGDDKEFQGISVRTISLDTFAEKHRQPGLVKIDTEGGETGALSGAVKVLELIRPKLIVSFHGEGLARECRHILGRHRYKARMVTPDTLLAVPGEM